MLKIAVGFAGSLDSNTSPMAQQALDGMLAVGARKMVVDCTALATEPDALKGL